MLMDLIGKEETSPLRWRKQVYSKPVDSQFGCGHGLRT